MKTIYINGHVFTGEGRFVEAFAVEDDRFAAVGTNEEILKSVEPEDEVISLDGRFVCPGFNDSHMHLLNYGNVRGQCDLAGAKSLTEVQERLRDFLSKRSVEEGAWLLGRGWNQDHFMPATGIPTRDDLDAVTAEHPVCIVRCCGHCMTVNSCALEQLGIDENTLCPEGGAIDRDARGRLTGVLRDAAMSLVYTRLPAPSRKDMKLMMAEAMQALNQVGITSCQTDDLCAFENVPWSEVIEAYRELEAEGRMSVRVYEQSQFTDTDHLQSFLDAGWCTGVGTNMFRIGPLKLLGDGSLGARTAFLSEAYADDPNERGLAIFTQEQMDALIGLAHRSGMQCAIHVIGDGILDRVLDAYEKAFDEVPRADHRSGVVHVQLTRQDQLERMRKLNLHAYVQTVFIDYDSHIVHARAGEKLASTSYAFHGMREMGMHVSNGTDCPVELPNPMRGLQCAVTRQPLDGSLPPYRPEEAMSVEEALLSYTVEGAHASFEESVKGRIAKGHLADFTVLSDDPFVIPHHAIQHIHVLRTVLGGRAVYVREHAC